MLSLLAWLWWLLLDYQNEDGDEDGDEKINITIKIEIEEGGLTVHAENDEEHQFDCTLDESIKIAALPVPLACYRLDEEVETGFPSANEDVNITAGKDILLDDDEMSCLTDVVEECIARASVMILNDETAKSKDIISADKLFQEQSITPAGKIIQEHSIYNKILETEETTKEYETFLTPRDYLIHNDQKKSNGEYEMDEICHDFDRLDQCFSLPADIETESCM